MINPGEPAPGSSPRPPGGRGVSGERRRPPRAGRSPQRAASAMLASRRTEKCSNEGIFSSAPLIFMFYVRPSLLMELLLNKSETELIEL